MKDMGLETGLPAATAKRPSADVPVLSEITLRPFLPEDAIPACGFVPDYPVMMLTAEIDGEVAAYGGLQLFAGRHWVAFHLADERLRRPMWLHRIMVKGLAAAERSGITPIYALCNEMIPRSRAWLAALGFRELAPEEKDEEMRTLERAQMTTDPQAVPHTTWVRP